MFFVLLLLLLNVIVVINIIYVYYICMCSLTFQTNRLSTEHPMFAPSDGGVGWSRGGRALRCLLCGFWICWIQNGIQQPPKRQKHVSMKDVLNYVYIHIRVSYLYYIMYLYNLYLLVPGFPHFQLWAQKKHPNMVFRSVEAVYTPWAVMGWIFPLWDGCWQIRTWSRFAIDSQCHHVPSPGTINYCGAPRRHVEIHSDSNCVANVSRIVKSRSLEDYRFHMISRSQDETPLKADRY